jgi:hypothetical protein
VGDVVEIIRCNHFKPMPGGLSVGSRGTVVGNADSMWICVDYGLPDTVHSARDSIRKLPRPPQDWVKLCNLTDLPREVTCE